MWLTRTVFLAAILGPSIACGGAVSGGIVDYEQARYPEALQRFRHAEPDAAWWDGRDMARYALYRGLTHLALGDKEAAARWLREAKITLDRDPNTFSEEERCRLAAALAHLPP